MKNVILFHGTSGKKEYYDSKKYRSLSNSHWFPWVQKQLLAKDIECHTPEVFEAYKPTYDKWLRELNRYDINKNTVLVGHSCGAGFLIRWMSENQNQEFKKVILVAPWLDPNREKTDTMFDFKINISDNHKEKIIVFYSDNDDKSIQDSVAIIKQSLPKIKYKDFHNYGRFCYGDLGTEEFPELLEEILK